MIRTAIPFLFLLASASSAADDNPSSPAEKLAAIKKQHMDVEVAFRKEMDALPETPEGEKKAEVLYKEFDKGQAERFMAAFAITKADPKSDAGFAALEWVLTTPRAYQLPVGKPALELATEHYADNPKIGKIASLGRATSSATSGPSRMRRGWRSSRRSPKRTRTAPHAGKP